MKKKKMVFIVSRYEINGIGTVVKNLIENIDREKFEVILCAEKIAEESFPVDKFHRVVNLDVKGQNTLIRKIKNVTGIVRSIINLDLKEEPDIVLSFSDIPNCYAVLALRLFRKSKAKVIITEHSEGFYIDYRRVHLKDKLMARLYKFMIYLLYCRADYIIPVSRNISELVKKLFLVKTKNVKVIYNPIDISQVQGLGQKEIDDMDFKTDVRYLAVVSRLSPEKGIDFLIRALAPIANELNLKLLIIGKGDHEKALRDLSEECRIGDRISFLGWKENPFKYLSKCELFVLPSLYEGFPNVILEAMACGVPVIASRCTAGIEEMISDEVTGILVPPKDVGALSESIRAALSDTGLRNRIRDNAYEHVRNFDVGKIIKQYEEILKD